MIAKTSFTVLLLLFLLISPVFPSSPFEALSVAVQSAEPSEAPAALTTNATASETSNTEETPTEPEPRSFNVLGRAIWFIILITVAPVLFCCCFVYLCYNFVLGPSGPSPGYGGAQGGGMFQPATSTWGAQGGQTAGGGMMGGPGGFGGQAGPGMFGGKSSQGCNIA